MKTKAKQDFSGDLFPELLPDDKARPRQSTVKKTSKNAEIRQLKSENAALTEKVHDLEKSMSLLQNKAVAYDDLIGSKSLFTIGIIAKSFGWSAIKLNSYLQKKQIQYFKSGIWMLYQKYANKGYTGEQFYTYYTDANGERRSRAHTYWTMKGYEFIREILKKDNLI